MVNYTLPHKRKYALKRKTITDNNSPGGGEDLLLICNPTKNITITLPSRGNSGQTIHVKNITAYTITVSGTIDGDTDGCELTAKYECVTFVRDENQEWWII